MKRIASAAFLAITMLTLEPASAQAPDAKDEGQLNRLLKEVQAQQTRIAENQAKIDAKLEALGETIHEARIYSSRVGR
jgi:hypothetical protein